MTRKQFGVFTLAAVLTVWKPRTAVLAVAVRPPLGLQPPVLWTGLRWGALAAAAIVSAVAASTLIPRVKGGMAQRDLPLPVWRWLLVSIPLRTVLPEETTYRGVLGTHAADAFGPTTGRLLQAAAFGLSHVPDARAAGEPVAGTVLVTGAAGWAFGWLFTVSGSLAAPMLAHLAANEAGAVAALLVQRRR